MICLLVGNLPDVEYGHMAAETRVIHRYQIAIGKFRMKDNGLIINPLKQKLL
jgi:hypothetical protein